MGPVASIMGLGVEVSMTAESSDADSTASDSGSFDTDGTETS